MDGTRPNDILQRTAPQNIEAEKSVIGAMLMDRDAIEKALGVLTKDDFYSRQYGMMFEAIRKLYSGMSKDAVVDLVTVQEQYSRVFTVCRRRPICLRNALRGPAVGVTRYRQAKAPYPPRGDKISCPERFSTIE